MAYGVLQFAQMASAFVFMPFLVRQFGLVDYGIYLLALAVSGYLGLLDLGVGATVIKMVAEYRARGQDARLSGLVSSTALFYVGIGALTGTVLALVGLYGINVFDIAQQGERLASHLFLTAAVLALVWWPANLGGLVLSGLQEYGTLSRIAVGATLLNALGTVCVLAWDLSPVVLLAVNSATGIFAGALDWVYVRRYLPHVRVAPGAAGLAALRSVFSLSWSMFVFHVCNVVIYQHTDRLVLGLFAGSAPVALYEGPAKMNSALQQVAGMAGTAVLPATSQLEAEGRTEALQALFLRGTKFMVALVGSLSATFAVLAGPILAAWLGGDYVSQTRTAQVFMVGWLVSVNLQVAWVMIMGLGRVASVLPYLIAQALANIALSISLVGPLGVLGVVVATVVTNVAATPFILAFVLRILGLGFRRWLTSVVLPTYPFLLVPVVLGAIARWAGLTGGLGGTVAAAGVALLACWAALYLVGFDDSERADTRAFVGASFAWIGIDRSPPGDTS